jgi:hypothetical protein
MVPSMTLTLNVEPSFVNPKTLAVDPQRKKFRILRVLAKKTESSTDMLLPTLKNPRKEQEDPSKICSKIEIEPDTCEE